MSNLKSVNENTLIPIGVAVVVIGAAAMWIANVQNSLRQHSEQIELLSKDHESSVKLNEEINSRLSRMEWRLEKQGDKNER